MNIHIHILRVQIEKKDRRRKLMLHQKSVIPQGLRILILSAVER
jgi:hypothetical protein